MQHDATANIPSALIPFLTLVNPWLQFTNNPSMKWEIDNMICYYQANCSTANMIKILIKITLLLF